MELERNKNYEKKYTFESFVSGKGNKVALTAALKIAKNPGTLYNPFYIYSDTGYGKTHLLKAIANYVFNLNDNYKIVYATAMEILKDFDYAQMNDLSFFDKKYGNADLLLIDDIQLLYCRIAIQQKLVYLLQSMIDRNKQIVISADCNPMKLTGFIDRLISMFQMGVQVTISKPDLSQRMSVLKNKVKDKNEKEFCEDVLLYISKKYSDNIRELEGALNRVLLYSEINKSDITLELAKKALNK